MEKECLDFLLRGKQSVVVCPARSITNMRMPSTWRKACDEGRLLILSPFAPKHGRISALLAEKRNRFVAKAGAMPIALDRFMALFTGQAPRAIPS
jgi:hypothetical protein